MVQERGYDTALKTANSGYLTRRLVDVAQDCIITIDDCKTENGITLRASMKGSEVVETLAERLLGRNLADDLIDLSNGNVILKKGETVTEDHMDLINNSGIDSAKIRSVLVCESRIGVCAKCYGRDLARGTDVNIGEAVGVIAAQSIGEPGTQLTMRTFHVGGAAQRGAEANNIEALVNGVVKLKDANLIKGPDGKSLVISRSAEMVIVNDQGQERARHRLLYGAKIFFEDGDNVNPGDVLLNGSVYHSNYN